MEQLTIGRHPINFYARNVIVFLLSLLPGTCLWLLFFTSVEISQSFNILAAVSLVLPVFSLYISYQYFSQVEIISLDHATIRIGSKQFKLNEIKSLKLTDLVPLRIIFTHKVDGVVIEFADGTVKYIYDNLHSNVSKLKKALEQVPVETGSVKPHQEHQQEVAADYHLDANNTYKGFQLLSPGGLVLWAPICYYLYLCITGTTDLIFISATLLLVAWFYPMSFNLHYFGLTKTHLIVRNHNLPWVRKAYWINNIVEIVFRNGFKSSNYLVVKTKDHKNNRFHAGTLWDSDWLTLKRDLEKMGVKVRNESIPE